MSSRAPETIMFLTLLCGVIANKYDLDSAFREVRGKATTHSLRRLEERVAALEAQLESKPPK
jgi:hypothetical protein